MDVVRQLLDDACRCGMIDPLRGRPILSHLDHRLNTRLKTRTRNGESV